jgi:ATP-dependent 26S proteasome regulatory subunit
MSGELNDFLNVSDTEIMDTQIGGLLGDTETVDYNSATDSAWLDRPHDKKKKKKQSRSSMKSTEQWMTSEKQHRSSEKQHRSHTPTESASEYINYQETEGTYNTESSFSIADIKNLIKKSSNNEIITGTRKLINRLS